MRSTSVKVGLLELGWRKEATMPQGVRGGLCWHIPVEHDRSQPFVIPTPAHAVEQHVPLTQKLDAQSLVEPHMLPLLRLNAAVTGVALITATVQVFDDALSQPVQDEKTPLELGVATSWTVVP